MYGAFLGDMIGAPYEFNRGSKTKDFPLFSEESYFTDDSVMTLAVAEALLDAGTEADEQNVKKSVIEKMKYWGRKYPDAGYGSRFGLWLQSEDTNAYGSWGNGSAMKSDQAAGMMNPVRKACRRRLLHFLTAKIS